MVSCVIGEVLWDVFPDGERFGGAALNFCANLQRLGDHATLLSAVGDDPHGQMALEQMRTLGVGTQGIHTVKNLPTGLARVSMNDHGEPSFAIPRPAAFDEVSVDAAMMSTLQASAVDWVYFGTLLQTNAATEQLTVNLKEQLHPARCFYDINLRTGHWNLALVQRLSRLASIIKLNEVEAETLFSLTSSKEETFSLETFCDRWASAYRVDVICVTLGPAGCMVYDLRQVPPRSRVQRHRLRYCWFRRRLCRSVPSRIQPRMADPKGRAVRERAWGSGGKPCWRNPLLDDRRGQGDARRSIRGRSRLKRSLHEEIENSCESRLQRATLPRTKQLASEKTCLAPG